MWSNPIVAFLTNATKKKSTISRVFCSECIMNSTCKQIPNTRFKEIIIVKAIKALTGFVMKLKTK